MKNIRKVGASFKITSTGSRTAIPVLLVAIALQIPSVAATVSFSFDMTGTAPGAANGGGETFTPTKFGGTLPPFGPCQAALGSGATSLELGLQNGGSIVATLASEPGSGPTLNAAGTITGGTGLFEGATGNFQLALTITGADSSSVTFSATGTGTIDAPNLTGGANLLPTSLQFQAPQGSTPSAPQVLILSNQGSNALSFTTSASVASKTDWLSVSSPGSVAAGASASIVATANPSGLALGVYEGQIDVAYGSVSLPIPVRFIVGDKGANLQLSESGESFKADVQGPAPAAQTVLVSNTGAGTLTGLTATTSVTGKVPNWLKAFIPPGFASVGEAPVTVTVDPGSLPAGLYSGQVNFNLPSAVNSPQSVSVQMRVAAGPLPTFQPESALMTLKCDLDTGACIPPGAVHVIITNPGKIPLTFTTTYNNRPFGVNAPWFAFAPASGSVAPGHTTEITISLSPGCTSVADGLAKCASLAFFQCCALLEVYFHELSYTYFLQTVLIAGGTSSAPPIPSWGPPPPGVTLPPMAKPKPRAVSSGPCTPIGLEPWITSIPIWFLGTVGEPAPLEAQIVDNCGNNLNSGTVIATFGSLDPPVALNPQGNGQWAATWTPRNIGSNAEITLQAASEDGIFGTRIWPGFVASGAATPLVNVGGVSNAASSKHVIAPGAFISIYGVNLASEITLASSTPLPTLLGTTQVFLGGQALPLQFSGKNQINAVVPYDIAPNSSQQLVVQAGDALSQPEPVTVATAAPGVFTQDQSGSGPGAILVQPAGASTSAMNTAANPARAGDALLIFCTGLGAVSPSIPAGSVAPSAPPLAQTVNPVTVTVGGIDTPVLFAGLAPGFVGLYQVNVTVPSGLAASTAVPVVLTVAGASSGAVTIAVK